MRPLQQNIDVLKIISFIEETMKTLSNYREQLKIKLDLIWTEQGM